MTISPTTKVLAFKLDPEALEAIDKLVDDAISPEFRLLIGMRSAVIRSAILDYVRNHPRKLDLSRLPPGRSQDGASRKLTLISIKADNATKDAFDRVDKGLKSALVRAAVIEAADRLPG